MSWRSSTSSRRYTPWCPSLREIASHKRIVVLVDELDRGWDSSEDARAFVAGLFQACISVNIDPQEPAGVHVAAAGTLRRHPGALRRRAEIPRPHRDDPVERDIPAQADRQADPALARRAGRQRRPDGLGVPVRQRPGAAGQQLVPLHDQPDALPAAGDHPVLQPVRRAGPRSRRPGAAPVRRGPGSRGHLLQRARPGHRRRIPLPVPWSAERLRRVPRQSRARAGARRPGIPVPGAHHPRDPVPRYAGLAGRLRPRRPHRDPVGRRVPAGRGGPGQRPALARGSEAFLGVHQVPHLNIAAARNFQVHPMFWAHLGSGNGAR